jgi:hypothetical protein
MQSQTGRLRTPAIHTRAVLVGASLFALSTGPSHFLTETPGWRFDSPVQRPSPGAVNETLLACDDAGVVWQAKPVELDRDLFLKPRSGRGANGVSMFERIGPLLRHPLRTLAQRYDVD